MPIYSLGQLCLGLFVGVAGVVFLAVSLLAAIKRKKFKTSEDRKSLFSSFLYTLYGAYWMSEAFDPPHQASQRTDIIGFVLMPIVFTALGIVSVEKLRLTRNPAP